MDLINGQINGFKLTTADFRMLLETGRSAPLLFKSITITDMSKLSSDSQKLRYFALLNLRVLRYRFSLFLQSSSLQVASFVSISKGKDKIFNPCRVAWLI